MYAGSCPRVADHAALDRDFPELEEPGFEAAPYPQIAVTPPGQKAVIVGELIGARIDEVEHRVVSTALLERESHHAAECGVRVALIPKEFAHLRRGAPRHGQEQVSERRRRSRSLTVVTAATNRANLTSSLGLLETDARDDRGVEIGLASPPLE